MQRLAVTMDGVLAEVYEPLFIYDENEFGKRRDFKEIIGVEERKGFPNMHQHLYL